MINHKVCRIRESTLARKYDENNNAKMMKNKDGEEEFPNIVCINYQLRPKGTIFFLKKKKTIKL